MRRRRYVNKAVIVHRSVSAENLVIDGGAASMQFVRLGGAAAVARIAHSIRASLV